MAFDSTQDIAEHIILAYEAANPHAYNAGERAINKQYLVLLLTEIFDVQLKQKAQVNPGTFKDTDNNSSVVGLGGPLL